MDGSDDELPPSVIMSESEAGEPIGSEDSHSVPLSLPDDIAEQGRGHGH